MGLAIFALKSGGPTNRNHEFPGVAQLGTKMLGPSTRSYTNNPLGTKDRSGQCEHGLPRLYVLRLYVDWGSRTVLKPYLISIQLDPRITNFKWVGVTDAAAGILNRQSYAYQEATNTYPKVFGNFLDHREVSLDDSVILGRVLIEIEEKVSPDEVGGAIRSVKITPNRKATELADFLLNPQPGIKKSK
jgi:hypothetical protein